MTRAKLVAVILACTAFVSQGLSVHRRADEVGFIIILLANNDQVIFQCLGGICSHDSDDYQFSPVEVKPDLNRAPGLFLDSVPKLEETNRILWKRKSKEALRKLAQQILASRKLVAAFAAERKMLPRLF